MWNSSTTPSTTFHVSHPSQPKGSRRSSNIVFRVLISLVILLVLFTAAKSIAWSIIHPIPPVFTLNSLSILNFTLSESQVNASCNIDLFVKNRSKKASLVIDEFDICVFYGKTQISETSSMELVKLDKMGNQSLSTRFQTKSLDCFVKRSVFDNLNEHRSKKVLNLNVRIRFRTRFGYGFWPSKEAHMKALCNNLNVNFRAKGSSGTAAEGTWKPKSGAKDCSIV